MIFESHVDSFPVRHRRTVSQNVLFFWKESELWNICELTLYLFVFFAGFILVWNVARRLLCLRWTLEILVFTRVAWTSEKRRNHREESNALVNICHWQSLCETTVNLCNRVLKVMILVISFSKIMIFYFHFKTFIFGFFKLSAFTGEKNQFKKCICGRNWAI